MLTVMGAGCSELGAGHWGLGTGMWVNVDVVTCVNCLL